jgi:hypothetical protein
MSVGLTRAAVIKMEKGNGLFSRTQRKSSASLYYIVVFGLEVVCKPQDKGWLGKSHILLVYTDQRLWIKADTLVIINHLSTRHPRTAAPVTLLERVPTQVLPDHTFNIVKPAMTIPRNQHIQISRMIRSGRLATTLQKDTHPEKQQGTVAASPTVLGPAT